jgi:acyl carrier protein
MPNENLKRYVNAFCEVFEVEESQLNSDPGYQELPGWDSVGHMALMARLEDEFSVELEIDDIIDFSSFEVGKMILKKYVSLD